MKKIKKGDKVQVVSGKFKGEISEIQEVMEDKVVVKKVNVMKKATKGQGFVEKTLPIHISNVMVYCDKCKKPVRVSIEQDKKGKKVRVCNKCKTQLK